MTVGLRGTVGPAGGDAGGGVMRGDVRATPIGVAGSAPDGCSVFELTR